MSALPGIQFGAGILFATPVGGQLPVDPTPQEVGIIQDISFTISGDIKELFGQFQFPVDSAVGKRTIKGTFNFAQLTNQFIYQAYLGGTATLAPGIIEPIYREPHTVPATPYMVTVTGSANWVADLGVINQVTGLPLINIGTGSPATGQYVVAAGVYTFAAADTTIPVTISYTQTAVSTGTTLTSGNAVMGSGPILSVTVPFLYQGNKMTFNFPNVRLGKIDVKTKLDDYLMMSSDFSAFAGAANNPFNSYNVG